jgi:hypothetical protein
MKTDLDEPRTLLFMSVDVVGSTAYKEQIEKTDGGPAWLGAFEKFFREFPLVLMGRMALCFDDAETVPQIALWRIAGDEMVFVAKTESAGESLALFESLHQAFIAYHEKLSGDYGLGLKGCCWAVDLPRHNIAIEIPELASGGDGTDGAYIEYLGPDVDLGFRIAKHVRGREIMISLQLANTLASASDLKDLVFRFSGSAVLKGVNFGRPYPLISASFESEGDQPNTASGPRYAVDSGTIKLSPAEIIEMALQFAQVESD